MRGYVKPEDRRAYQATMRFVEKLGEHAAEELFKWVGWAVVIAAIRLAALRSGDDLLRYFTWVLFAAVLLRIQWRLNRRLPEEETLDGGLTFKGNLWASVLVGAVGVFAAYLVAIRAPDALIRADFLKDASRTAAGPAVSSAATVPLAPRK